MAGASKEFQQQMAKNEAEREAALAELQKHSAHEDISHSALSQQQRGAGTRLVLTSVELYHRPSLG